MTKRIGLLTAGADAPGQNVCLKGIVNYASLRGFEAIGIRKGWEGLLNYNPDNPPTHGENVIALTATRVRDIDRMSGSYLHSSRVNPSRLSADSVPKHLHARYHGEGPFDLSEHIQRVVKKLDLEALFVLGDRDSLKYAAHLSALGIPILGIPKTVQNDISGTEYSLGFSTALGRGVQFVHEVRAMAGSREEITVIEVLGRSHGLTTLLIALLSSADRILIPEVPFDPERLAKFLVEDKSASPNNYSILVMSEASTIEPEKIEKYAPELSRLANSRALAAAMATQGRQAIQDQSLYDLSEGEIGTRVIGAGAVVTEILENITGQRFLFQPLSYLIRTGHPDGQDLLGAMNFATLAVNLLVEGKTGRLVAYRRQRNYVDLPLDVVNEPEGMINVASFYDANTYHVNPTILWATQM